MTLIVSLLNPTHAWLYFIVLQVALFVAQRGGNLAKELLVPFEIVLIAVAFLFFIGTLPGIIFFTVICTIGGLFGSLFVSTQLNDRLLNKSKSF